MTPPDAPAVAVLREHWAFIQTNHTPPDQHQQHIDAYACMSEKFWGDRSWWCVPPEEFATVCADYNVEQKKLGESELLPEVRAALLDLENRQHRADSELPARPKK